MLNLSITSVPTRLNTLTDFEPNHRVRHPHCRTLRAHGKLDQLSMKSLCDIFQYPVSVQLMRQWSYTTYWSPQFLVVSRGNQALGVSGKKTHLVNCLDCRIHLSYSHSCSTMTSSHNHVPSLSTHYLFLLSSERG